MNASGAGRHGRAPSNSANLYGCDGGVCVRACVHACVRACVSVLAHACLVLSCLVLCTGQHSNGVKRSGMGRMV